MGMDLGEWEVAKDKAQLVPELLLDRSHDGRRSAGVGAFVVAILYQRDRGCCRSLTVVPLIDGYHKMFSLCHRHLSFWCSQEADGKGERFSSQGDASVPSPHLTSPALRETGHSMSPRYVAERFLFEVSTHYKPWCLWKVKHRSSRLEEQLVDVTPDPVLSRLEGLNDRMVGRVEMPGCVLVL